MTCKSLLNAITIPCWVCLEGTHTLAGFCTGGYTIPRVCVPPGICTGGVHDPEGMCTPHSKLGGYTYPGSLVYTGGYTIPSVCVPPEICTGGYTYPRVCVPPGTHTLAGHVYPLTYFGGTHTLGFVYPPVHVPWQGMCTPLTYYGGYTYPRDRVPPGTNSRWGNRTLLHPFPPRFGVTNLLHKITPEFRSEFSLYFYLIGVILFQFLLISDFTPNESETAFRSERSDDFTSKVFSVLPT